ncbi:MAG: PD-(D/E)XK nuclease family protein, partial [Elusimicrobiaceae bacterium]
MQKLYYGPFSRLEEKFSEYLADERKNPLSPVLVVVPSGRMGDYLSRVLVRKNGACANIVFETFSSLSNKLAFEKPRLQEPGSPVPEVVSDAGFQDFLFRYILEAFPPPESGYVSRGFAGAVRSSARDMVDALVEPDAVLALLNEGVFDKWGDADRMRWLLKVRAAYSAAIGGMPVLTRFEILRRAVEGAAASVYLSGFEKIIFYGFYDLTGIQLELFNSVRQGFPVILFYPYEKHPAYKFTGKFFETNIIGYAGESVCLDRRENSCALGKTLSCLFTEETGAPDTKAFQLAAVSGLRAEARFAAREILRLVETEGFAFSEIAVAARSVEPYCLTLAAVFEESLIPFHLSASVPVEAKPLARLARTLLELRRKNYPCESMAELWTSPYFTNYEAGVRLSESFARSGITRGFEQWDRLFSCDALPSALAGDVRLFSEWLLKTDKALARLEKSGSWGERCDGAWSFVSGNIRADAFNGADSATFETVHAALAAMKHYGLVRSARQGEFLDEVSARLGEAAAPLGGNSAGGVEIMDAMSARGRRFRAVIVLGLNEKVFPRLIREDPVLRDTARVVLRDTLGYWINPKLDSYDEEKLLFYLLAESAGERFVCVYQRSDSEGKVKVVSGLVAELSRACGGAERYLVSVPRRMVEELSGEEQFLSEAEMSLKLAFSCDIEKNYADSGLDTPSFKERRAFSALLSAHGAAGPSDGIIGPRGRFLAELKDRGFSPSSLEELGKCPMKFYFSRVLGLRPENIEVFQSGPDSRTVGTYYHGVLFKTYKELAESGFWEHPVPDIAAASAVKNFEELVPSEMPGIYPVAWEVLRDRMHESVKAFAAADTGSLGGLRPSAFEVALQGRLAELKDYKCRGIADRIDVCPADGTFLVVDYKTKLSGSSKSLEKDVKAGESFQPFLYFLMAARGLPQLSGLKS